MSTGRITGVVAGILALVAFAAGWMLFAPTQIGGGTSYAIIVGNSMEPVLHRGDLAVIRERRVYRPGDVVLYDSRELGAKVLHRIARVEDGRFVLKGDNNDFLDSERPAEEQIVGTLWLHVPAFGRLSGWLREPLHGALLVGVVTLLALGGLGAGAAVGRSGSSRSTTHPVRAVPPPSPEVGRDERLRLLAGLVLAAVACAGLAAVSFTRPLTAVESHDAAYVHQGRFAYEATVARNAAYPDGTVTTGQPVFLRLVPRLLVSFDYRLESQLPVTARGLIRLDARVSDGRGWERTLPLTPERPYANGRARVSGTLDLRRIERLVENVRDLTGSAQTTYTVAVLPDVSVSGRVGADPVETTFAPALLFDLGDLRLQPNLGGEGEGEGVGPLAPREAGSGTRTVAAELSLGSLSLSVATARKVSLAGLAALLLLGGVALIGRPRNEGEEHARIAARYGHLLLAVRPPAPEWPQVTELADMEALVRLATHHGRMILHVADAAGHSYVVEDAGSVFLYQAGAPVLRAALAPSPAIVPSRSSATHGPVRRLADGELIPGGGGVRYRAPRRLGRRRRHEEW